MRPADKATMFVPWLPSAWRSGQIRRLNWRTRWRPRGATMAAAIIYGVFAAILVIKRATHSDRVDVSRSTPGRSQSRQRKTSCGLYYMWMEVDGCEMRGWFESFGRKSRFDRWVFRFESFDWFRCNYCELVRFGFFYWLSIWYIFLILFRPRWYNWLS